MEQARMKTLLISSLLTICYVSVIAQTYSVSSEVQSSFIDITGLFGVKEATSVTQFKVTQKGFALDLYHGFSLEKFGKTVQTIATPSFKIKLDNAGILSIKPKVEIAHIQASGGGFVRPGIHLIFQPSKNNVFNYANWLFFDMREKENYPKRLNGLTYFFSYTHTSETINWKFTQESRVLLVDIFETLKVSGAFQNVTFSYKPVKIYFGVNGVYSFYRSDNKNEFLWNAIVGKTF